MKGQVTFLTLAVVSLVLLAGGVAIPAQLAGDGGQNAPAPWKPAAGDWPMFRHNAAHAGLTDVKAQRTFSLVKWSTRIGSRVNSEMTVSDVKTSDREPEILAGASDGRLVCLGGSTGKVKWRFQAGAQIWSTPALGDIDGDGRAEVVFTSLDGRIYVVSGEDGTLLWKYTTRDSIYGAPTLADLDLDGIPEVVVAGSDGFLYAFRGNGSLLWWARLNIMYASPSVGDLDADGKPEVLIQCLDGKAHALRGASGSELWVCDTGHTSIEASNSPVMGNLDADVAAECLFSMGDGILYCVDGASGALTWKKELGHWLLTPAIGDGDRDGTLEVYIGGTYIGGYDRLSCLDGATGEVEWRTNESLGASSPPVLGDINGDGRLEVLGAFFDQISGQQYLRMLRASDGTQLWIYPSSARITTPPILADGDGDGNGEIFFTNDQGRVSALDSNF